MHRALKSWELRTSMSLARLWSDQGKVRRVRIEGRGQRDRSAGAEAHEHTEAGAPIGRE
jgi:hypothetical protein